MQRTVCLLINKENSGDETIDKGMKDEIMTGNGYHDVVCWHRIVSRIGLVVRSSRCLLLLKFIHVCPF